MLSIATYVIIPLVIGLALFPKLINWSISVGLVDLPSSRKVHATGTPFTGGIYIAITMVVSALWLGRQFSGMPQYWPVLVGAVTLHIMGLMDDKLDLSAKLKLLIQLGVAWLPVSTGLYIQSAYGLFGIEQLEPWIGKLLTVVVITGITNGFNLLDGINGLAGGVGVILFAAMGLVLHEQGSIELATICLTICGALISFLVYNLRNGRIFMGDNGSLLLGFLLASLSIKILNGPVFAGNNNLTIVFGLCIVPVFDSLRVYASRVLKGNSPFKADRTHVHHELLKTGMNHIASSISVYFATIVILVCTYFIVTNGDETWKGIVLVTLSTITVWHMVTITRLYVLQRTLQALRRTLEKKYKLNHLLTKSPHHERN